MVHEGRGYGGGAFGLEEIADAIADVDYATALTDDVSAHIWSFSCTCVIALAAMTEKNSQLLFLLQKFQSIKVLSVHEMNCAISARRGQLPCAVPI